MIVVVIIGLLAAMALPAFQRVKRAAVSKRYLNDLRQFSQAVERYTLENGAFPPNGSASIHSSLRGYVPDKLFGPSPIGGVWDWDYLQGTITAAVSVWQFTVSDEQLIDIDRTIDDGNLNSGLFIKDGQKAIYIIEP
jgi:type II secretory pathway pseudopilin PulG